MASQLLNLPSQAMNITSDNCSMTNSTSFLVITKSDRPSEYVYVLAAALGVVAFLLSLACLIFNFALRHNRVIKMSSPRLNVVIACGGILGSSCCGLYAVDYFHDTDSSTANITCQVRVALLATSFSLIYGPMIGKTWRVNRIFRLAGAKRVVIKDFQLLAFTLVLVVLDGTVLALWTLLDQLKFSNFIYVAKIQDNITAAVPLNDVTASIGCVCQWPVLWSAALLLYKLPYLLFGLREAWWTRGLILPNLNEASCIVASSSTALMMTMVYLVTSISFRTSPTVVDTCAVAAIFFCVIVAIGVVFIPKFLLWRRTPTGRVAARVSISSTSSSMAVLQSFEHLEAELNTAHSEIDTLREFIKQKESDIDRLTDLLSNAEQDLANISFIPDAMPDLDAVKHDKVITYDKEAEHISKSDSSHCDSSHCCLHAKRTNETTRTWYIPTDKGYAPAHQLDTYHHSHSRRHDNVFACNGGCLMHNSIHTSLPNNVRSHLEVPVHPGYRRGSHCEIARDREIIESHMKRSFQPDMDTSDTIDDVDSDMIARRYALIRRRRRSSTPSIASVASLSKLSKLRSDLSDASALSQTLSKTWLTELEEGQRKRRNKNRDRQRRRTAMGVREITDSILESYDFQWTSDNQSFVSECITPRSSEASYSSVRTGSSSSKSTTNNNLRKFRQNKRKQINAPIASISYTKNQCHFPTRLDSETKANSEDKEDYSKDEMRVSFNIPSVESTGRISPTALYYNKSRDSPLSFLPPRNVSIQGIHNQVTLRAHSPSSVIVNDDYYPDRGENNVSRENQGRPLRRKSSDSIVKSSSYNDILGSTSEWFKDDKSPSNLGSQGLETGIAEAKDQPTDARQRGNGTYVEDVSVPKEELKPAIRIRHSSYSSVEEKRSSQGSDSGIFKKNGMSNESKRNNTGTQRRVMFQDEPRVQFVRSPPPLNASPKHSQIINSRASENSSYTSGSLLRGPSILSNSEESLDRRGCDQQKIPNNIGVRLGKDNKFVDNIYEIPTPRGPRYVAGILIETDLDAPETDATSDGRQSPVKHLERVDSWA